LEGRHWQVDLEPRLDALRAIIETIRFSGAGWSLEAMETRETNGDIALVTFSQVETQLEPSPAQYERIFSVDSPDNMHPSATNRPRAGQALPNQ
jgi:hypothetical protein